ncbi:MAG: alpha-amylase family glycosyl hydrolase [Candidatus Zhuqueibacterota bacterium]
MSPKRPILLEFHISRSSRDYYQFDDSLFSTKDEIIFSNFYAVRVFAKTMNDKRDLVSNPEHAIKAGDINAMGLIGEIFHYVFTLFQEEKNISMLEQALHWLTGKFGSEELDNAFIKFIEDFPPRAVYKGEQTAREYLTGATNGVPHTYFILEEMIMLWISNMNPAYTSFMELFDDTALEQNTCYSSVLAGLHDFFDEAPHFGPDNQNIIDMLRSPAIAQPHSLSGQLEYIRKHWGFLLGKYFYRLLSGLDLIREEQKMGFFGPGPSYIYEYSSLQVESEKFSQDLDWMPKVVLLAKNTYVWLDQLSKKYQRSIHRLDQVPDNELETIAGWGFTAIWLIGLWERSRASKKIKQMCGNPEAEASAYSLLSYEISDDLGGWDAFNQLRNRAWQRGIRLSGDMVPNHVGIDAQWVIEHPDWFIQLDHSPFPSYTFNGPNVSWDNRVGIYLEDHYFNRTDAAVVFKRVDYWTGNTTYIYHGNDGTSMPWSDTAQLNYLNADVREAVIQTILHVARNFPIIRFDAAMTLTKKHFKRLWYPDPGTGGDIPSRAAHGLTVDRFNELMPQEFWREVVDRVTREVPDTLLMAEAFWLLEGFFVRTLGMHRVYNSAFMNMLKTEENGKYRSAIKNTLEFNPEIMKRFVNFMSNPDEDTAIAQFGQDDKYFGVCAVMATMPGLPMFGHGQVEGFTEKYGMEYRRAYWDERPSEHLIQRHEREIFPLLRRRYIFSGVDNFLLYDVFTPQGFVDENVFAYSNRVGQERALVVYHNKYARAQGWIKTSVGFSVKAGDGDERKIIQKTLGEGLVLTDRHGYFCIFKDIISGLEYIRNCHDIFEQGLYVELEAFKYHVFSEFREVQDNEWRQYSQIASYLNGRGVPNIEETMKEIFLAPIHIPFKAVANASVFRELFNARLTSPRKKLDETLLADLGKKMMSLMNEVKNYSGGKSDEKQLTAEWLQELKGMLALATVEHRYPSIKSGELKHVTNYLKTNNSELTPMWAWLFGWLIVHSLGKIIGLRQFEQQSRSWIDELLLGKILTSVYQELGLTEQQVLSTMNLIKVLTTHQNWNSFDGTPGDPADQVLHSLLRDNEVQTFIGMNRYNGILWFNKETFDMLLDGLMVISLVTIISDSQLNNRAALKRIREMTAILQKIRDAENASDFKIEQLIHLVRSHSATQD